MHDKKEVDVVIGDAKVAIEIKSTKHVETKYKKGLKALNEEYPDCRLISLVWLGIGWREKDKYAYRQNH